MIHCEPAFSLPLVNHFVQQRMLNFGPSISLYVAPADADLDCAVVTIECDFPEPGLHAV
jgi:hypothetical protein